MLKLLLRASGASARACPIANIGMQSQSSAKVTDASSRCTRVTSGSAGLRACFSYKAASQGFAACSMNQARQSLLFCHGYSQTGNSSDRAHLCASPIPSTLNQTTFRRSSRSCQVGSLSMRSDTSSSVRSLANMRRAAGTWKAQQSPLSFPTKCPLSSTRTFSQQPHRTKLHRCLAQQPLSSCLLLNTPPQSEFVSWNRRQIQAKATGNTNAEVAEPDSAPKLHAGNAALTTAPGSGHDSLEKPSAEAQEGDSKSVGSGNSKLAERGDSGRLSAQWLKQSLWDDNAAEAQRSVGELITTWRTRATSFARESALLIYSALIDNTLVVVLEWLQADKALRRWTPLLEEWMAKLFGSWYTLHDGKRVPLSLVNNTAGDFSVPEIYRPADLPFADLRDLGYDPRVAHMLSLCMKAVYEQPEIIQDLAEHRWGLSYHGYFLTQTEATGLFIERENTEEFIPRTRATILSSKYGLIIAFRGSEPTNLINLRSSGRITMRPRFDMGRVHDGFHAALFHSDPEAGSLYSQLVETLLSADSSRQKPIFLTGHSLGGALAGLFAAALKQKHPEVSTRICGIYTFGQPRIGDAEFCGHMDAAFPNQLFRIVHAADIIPLVPPKFLEYRHFGQEHYLTTLGNHVWEPADLKRARRIETFGFIPLYVYKLAAGLVSPNEGLLRSVYRFVLLFLFPGLSDHWPSDYCGKLRHRLEIKCADENN